MLYNLSYGTNGPYSGVVMDSAGNLYGTTGDATVVFELSPSGGGWTFTDLHDFTGGLNDGGLAYGGLVFVRMAISMARPPLEVNTPAAWFMVDSLNGTGLIKSSTTCPAAAPSTA